MKIQAEAMDEPSLNVSSLIDMVFLLLVYFMVVGSLRPSEADLGIRLPGMMASSEQVDLPDEQVIYILAAPEGSPDQEPVELNSLRYSVNDELNLPRLVDTLRLYRQSSESSKNVAMVTIAAEDEVRHQRVIDVMDACAQAGIDNVTFSMSGE